MLKDIPIKSPELLEILDRWVSVMDIEGFDDAVHVWHPNENNEQARTTLDRRRISKKTY